MLPKSPHILISADLLAASHIESIAQAVEGWATWERIPQETPAAEVAQALDRADILVGWAPANLLLKARVQVYLCGSAGYDAYQGFGLNQKRGFVHCSARGTMSVTIAEHALALMLYLTRHLRRHTMNQTQSRWERLVSQDLAGSTICIVGLGDTGTELARRCAAFDMKIVGVKRTAQLSSVATRVFPTSQLIEAVAGADHVVACLPGGGETRHIFNAAVFDAMKPGAAFYAVSRGSVIDFSALVQALESGRLMGAGLDVTDPEPLPSRSPALENAPGAAHLAQRRLVGESSGKPVPALP